jgi:hypothetical protein
MPGAMPMLIILFGGWTTHSSAKAGVDNDNALVFGPGRLLFKHSNDY